MILNFSFSVCLPKEKIPSKKKADSFIRENLIEGDKLYDGEQQVQKLNFLHKWFEISSIFIIFFSASRFQDNFVMLNHVLWKIKKFARNILRL